MQPGKLSPFSNKPMAAFLSQYKEYVKDVVWEEDYQRNPIYLATVNMEGLQVWQEYDEPGEEIYSWFYPGDIPAWRIIDIEVIND